GLDEIIAIWQIREWLRIAESIRRVEHDCLPRMPAFDVDRENRRTLGRNRQARLRIGFLCYRDDQSPSNRPRCSARLVGNFKMWAPLGSRARRNAYQRQQTTRDQQSPLPHVTPGHAILDFSNAKHSKEVIDTPRPYALSRCNIRGISHIMRDTNVALAL